MKNKIKTLIKNLYEYWCLFATFYDKTFGYVRTDENSIFLENWYAHIFIELQKMGKDFQLSDYNDKIWNKKFHAPSYEKIKNLQGNFLWNNDLKHTVLLFRDSKNNLRMACYNRSKGFVLSPDPAYEIECLLRHKNSYPKLNAREYYFAFSEDL